MLDVCGNDGLSLWLNKESAWDGNGGSLEVSELSLSSWWRGTRKPKLNKAEHMHLMIAVELSASSHIRHIPSAWWGPQCDKS